MLIYSLIFFSLSQHLNIPLDHMCSSTIFLDYTVQMCCATLYLMRFLWMGMWNSSVVQTLKIMLNEHLLSMTSSVLYALTMYHGLASLINRNSFITVLKAGNPNIQVPPDLAPGESPLQDCFPAMSSHGWESFGLSSSYYEDPNSIPVAPPSWLHLTWLPRKDLQILSHWWLGIQHMNLGETDMQSTVLHISLHPWANVLKRHLVRNYIAGSNNTYIACYLWTLINCFPKVAHKSMVAPQHFHSVYGQPFTLFIAQFLNMLLSNRQIMASYSIKKKKI